MLNLLEWAKLNPTPLTAGVVEIIVANNPVLARMAFESINGPAYVWNKEDTLPGIAFRGINESFTESTGVIQPDTEVLKIAGGDSDYDKFLLATGTGSASARSVHDQMKAKALALVWLRTFFDGNSEANPREFDGLNARLTGAQHIALASGGAQLTLKNVNALIDAVVGTPSVLLMNKAVQRKITDLAQGTPNITYGQDALGRRMAIYAGVPIGVVEEDETGKDILGFDENDGASNLDTASMYAVAFGPDRVKGIQNAPIDVRDLGEIDTKPAERTRIEWYASFVAKHPKAAARLSRINVPT